MNNTVEPMTSRARQKRLKRRVHRDEWSRLMKKNKPINISEVWNLDEYTAKYVAPRLKNLIKIIKEKEVAPAVLADGTESKGLKLLASPVDECKIWQQMLDDMLFAFEYYAEKNTRVLTATEEDKERVKKGLRLFAEWYDYLWY